MKNSIDKERLKKICKLARLQVEENEVEKYLKMLNTDLATLDELESVDFGDFEPLVNPCEITLRQYEDVVSDGNLADDLMKCAPKELYNYFVVPKVMEK